MLEVVLRRLTVTGWRRGRAGSRSWLVVASVAGGIRLLRRVTRSQPEVLYRTRVRSGEQFEIVTRAPAKR
jgi:hypothetical protein